MKDFIVILGPTASGKTEFAIKYAKENKGEIISADSMQVYRGMDIGTAKPMLKERQGIPHYLIDIRNPNEEWTVSDFVKEANRISGDLVSRGKKPIIVGGTGLYLWALLEGYSFPITPADKELREKLEKESPDDLYSRLQKVDSKAAEKIHPNDKKRIIRALEVFALTGKPISELQKEKEAEHRTPNTEHRKLIGLNLPREILYERIDKRVDTMLQKGLIDEVKSLIAKGYDRSLPSLQALGYKEVIDHLDGKYDYDKMVNLLKQKTRNLARRQMTWFRRFHNICWLKADLSTEALRSPEG